MTGLVTPLYNFVKYTESVNDVHLTVFTRSQAVSWACGRLNISDCVNNANRDYKTWMADDTKEYVCIKFGFQKIKLNRLGLFDCRLTPNLRRLISCTAIADGGRTEWKFGFDKYLNSTLPNEKTELLRSITCTVNVTILNEYICKKDLIFNHFNF